GRVTLAWRGEDGLVWTHEPEGTYGSLVVPDLERWSFQASDASVSDGDVAMLAGSGFRYRQCLPLNAALRDRFNIRAVQSWPMAGEIVPGRLFALSKGLMGLRAPRAGEAVARPGVVPAARHPGRQR